MLINHYLLLGLDRDADQRQIKTAYRRKAKRFHPDTNQGSEAAAELFRQLNEAYRILSDSALRQSYDLELTEFEQAERVRKAAEEKVRAKATENPQPAVDPQQKFQSFLNSLLDALFEPPNPDPGTRAPPEKKPTSPTRRRPDFNFYYYLAMERKKPSYSCGDDGVYRRVNPSKGQPVRKPGRYGRFRGGSLLLIFFSSLWNMLFP